MRDINEPSYSQSSRTKFKQRIAGGAVLLIVLGIFLPFIFNHSHMKTAANQEAGSAAPAPQQAVPANAAAPASASTPAQASAPTPDSSAANVNPAANQTSAPAQAPGQAEGQVQTQILATTDLNAVANDANQATDSGLTPTPNESATTSGTVPSQMVQPPAAVEQQPVAQQAPAVQSVEPPVQQPKPVAAATTAPAQVTSAGYPAGHWLVQVGSFNQASNAQQLVSRLRKNGLAAFAKREPSGMVRVYIPAATQAQAAKIQNQVSNQFQLTSFIRERQR